MKVGDTYKVYLEVAPGVFEPLDIAASIKTIDEDNKQVKLVLPATLITMDTKVEIDTTPPAPVDTGNSHVMLGLDDGNISGGPVTQPVIPQDVQQAVELATSAPVGVGTPVQTVTPTDIAHEPETTEQIVVGTPSVDPSAPPVES